MQGECAKCISENHVRPKGSTSFLSSLLIILIPKCPLCIMAYSSAITMCGGQSIYMAENNWVSYIPLALSAVIILLLVKNYRDRRTILSIGLSLVGAAMLAFVHQLMLPPIYYNFGSVLLFFAIWLNGSFYAFVSTLQAQINRWKIQWQE